MWSEISQFHFLRPEWFLALIPLAIAIAWLRFEKTAQGDWHQLIPEHLLKHLIHEQRGASSKHAITLLALLWLLCVFALAGPTWQKIPQPVYEKIDARVYVLDLSYSMYAADLKPNRITRARLKLLDMLAKNREGYSALIVFSGDAHVVTPLTNDTNTIASLVPSLEPNIMPNIGSNASDGIQKALELLNNTKVEQGKIILISDEVPYKEITRINAIMSNSPFSLSILGIGTKEGAPIKLPNGQFLKDNNGSVVVPKLDSSSLEKLAELHQGAYVSIQQTDRDIDYLLKEEFTENDAREGTQQYDIWFESGQWLMLPILFLAALSFRRGWILSLLLCSFILSTPENTYADSNTNTMANPIQQTTKTANKNETATEAGLLEKTQETFLSWFQTGDQRGLSKFKQQKFMEAAELFNNKDWKASALFYSGQFAEASENFEINENTDSNIQSDSWYNKGNALAFAGDYDGAIKAYNHSLELNPENDDASFNKELVKKAKELEKQQQENQKQQDQNSQEQQDSQQNSSEENSSESNSSQQESSQQESSQQDSSQQDSSQQERSNQDSSQENSESQDNSNSQAQNQENSEQQESQNNPSQDKQENTSDSSEQENKDNNSEASENEQTENKESSAEESNTEEQGSEEQSAEQASDDEQAPLSPLSTEEREKQQALEQWLRQIPDDPSGLMRRKFSLESKRNPQKRSDEQQVW